MALMILVAAVILAVAQEVAGRVVLVMLATGLGSVALATTAALRLFRTLGAFGESRGVGEHTLAFVATLVVLVLTMVAMVVIIVAGATLLQIVIG